MVLQVVEGLGIIIQIQELAGLHKFNLLVIM